MKAAQSIIANMNSKEFLLRTRAVVVPRQSLRVRASFRKLLLTLFCFLPLASRFSLFAQDVHFSQFSETPLLRNPALAGIFDGDYRVTALYRNQWSSVSKAFQTALLHGEARFPVRTAGERPDFVSVGAVGWYDRTGSAGLRNTGGYATLAYNKSVSSVHRSFLTAGFSAGYAQRAFDASQTTWSNQWSGTAYNPALPSRETFAAQSTGAFDVAAGVSFASAIDDRTDDEGATTYYLGLGAYHLTRPRQSFYAGEEESRLAVRWSGGGGVAFPVGEALRAQLHANVFRQGTSTEVIGGGLLRWQRYSERQSDPLFAIAGGLFYRHADALIPTVRLTWAGTSVGVSYDVNFSKLQPATQTYGGFEISLSHAGLFKNPRSEMSRTSCPTF